MGPARRDSVCYMCGPVNGYIYVTILQATIQFLKQNLFFLNQGHFALELSMNLPYGIPWRSMASAESIAPPFYAISTFQQLYFQILGGNI